MSPPATSSMATRRTRALAAAALAGTAYFAIVCGVDQFLRGDLDWTRAPLSFYLLGPHGALVKSAYVMLSVSMVLLAVGYYRALAPGARSGAPVLLFVLGSIALVVTAFAASDLKAGRQTLEGLIHLTAALAAFLCTTTAMFLQAWRLRDDVAWRPKFRIAFTFAMSCFALVWVLAFERGLPRGLAQKTVIALIVAWLMMAAVWLWRANVRPSDPPPGDARD